jgi:hypothetical protein
VLCRWFECSSRLSSCRLVCWWGAKHFELKMAVLRSTLSTHEPGGNECECDTWHCPVFDLIPPDQGSGWQRPTGKVPKVPTLPYLKNKRQVPYLSCRQGTSSYVQGQPGTVQLAVTGFCPLTIATDRLGKVPYLIQQGVVPSNRHEVRYLGRSSGLIQAKSIGLATTQHLRPTATASPAYLLHLELQ